MQAASEGVLMMTILQSLVTVCELARAWSWSMNTDKGQSTSSSKMAPCRISLATRDGLCWIIYGSLTKRRCRRTARHWCLRLRKAWLDDCLERRYQAGWADCRKHEEIGARCRHLRGIEIRSPRWRSHSTARWLPLHHTTRRSNCGVRPQERCVALSRGAHVGSAQWHSHPTVRWLLLHHTTTRSSCGRSRQER